MNREDAEEAMDACNEADPFKVGRLLMMRWGKNVKKIVKRGHGTGGVKPILRKAGGSYGHDLVSEHDNRSQKLEQPRTKNTTDIVSSASTVPGQPSGPPPVIEMRTGFQNIAIPDRYQAEVHHKDSFTVEVPSNKQRFNFISRVAFFVSKDGSHLERRLIQREGQNPKFGFLTLAQNATKDQRREHIFYRWRVYAFCQGDGFSTWRTEPFVMFHPYGRFWIPPAIDKEAALLEEMNERNRQEMNERNRKERRRLMGKREYMTGRQMERARDGRRKGSRRGVSKFDGGTKMGAVELEQFNVLVKQKLSVSRKAICEAMSFCFEQSGSAKEISELVREALIDSSATLEMRIARLYLLSDILFNSQQPGVKNAFLYRDAIEKMAPEIFSSLGRHGGGNIGRMTMNKLRTAVSSVLAGTYNLGKSCRRTKLHVAANRICLIPSKAWTDWSVYNPAFLDELEARFEGREIEKSQQEEENEDVDEIIQAQAAEEPEVGAKVILDKPRGDWKDVNEDEESCPNVEAESNGKHTTHGIANEDVDGVLIDETDGVPLDAGDIGGDKQYDTSCEPGSNGAATNDVEGAPIEEEDVNGEALDDDSRFADATEKTHGKKLATDEALESHGSDVDKDKILNCKEVQDSEDASMAENNTSGDVTENGGDLDGEPVDGDLDGEPIDGETICMRELDGEELDEDLDGEALYDEEFGGEELDAGIAEQSHPN